MRLKSNARALLACAAGAVFLAAPPLCQGQDAGLVGHWTFDDPANLGKDSVSTNHGTVIGGAYSFAASRVGAGALAVNGADGHIAVPASASLRFAADQSCTLSVWVKTASLTGGWRGILTKSRDLLPCYGIWLNDSSYFIAGGDNITGPQITEDWHHVAVVQDGANNTREMFVDGESAVAGIPNAPDGGGPVWIGGAAGVTEFFNGWIDDARIYNRALTADEIVRLFNTPTPSTQLPLALTLQPDDIIMAPGGKASFIALANSLDLTYQWYKGTTPVGASGPAVFANGGAEATLKTDALTIADSGATYSVVFTGPSGSVTSRGARVTVTNPVLSHGFLKRELYSNIAGASVADLTAASTFPGEPDVTGLVGLFEAPAGIGDAYGQRLTGFVTPTETANYIFYLAADDTAELYLGTDETEASKQLIASELQWNNWRAWIDPAKRNPDAPENRSSPILLEAGRQYYVEVLHKEDVGGDHLAVTAIKQGDPEPENESAPLGGAFIATMSVPTGQTLSITHQPTNVTTIEQSQVTFTVTASASRNATLAYQWQRDGTNLFKANQASYTTPPISVTDNGAKFRCVIYLPGNVLTNTVEAVVKVDTDRTPPALAGVLAPKAQDLELGNEVYVVFSEAIDAPSGTNSANYSITPAITINTITLSADKKTVVLSTSDLSLAKNYTLTVKDVIDLAMSHNRISPTTNTFQVSTLVAHYMFDTAATLGADSNGINSGTPVGGASFSAETRIGGGALRVDGVNGHIEVPASPLLHFDNSQSCTVSLWVKTAALTGGWRGIVGKSRDALPGYGVWLDSSSAFVAGTDNLFGPHITEGWHHVAVVQDGLNGTREMFVDGASAAVGVPNAPDGGGALWIGGAASVTEFFNGWIDDVRIYNAALTAEEVLALATAAMPEPRVSLTVSRGPGGLRIAWPSSATGFTLETTGQIGAASWQQASPAATLQGNEYIAVVPIEAQGRFYRLKK